MAQNAPATRTVKDFTGFTGGVNSYLAPHLLNDNEIRWAENAVNKGGMWQTRPGFKEMLSLCKKDYNTPFGEWWIDNGQPDLFPQFFTVFQQIGGAAQAVFVINGVAWRADILGNGDFAPPSIIPNITFDVNAPFIVGQECVKSATIGGDGVIVTEKPYKVLVLQDGVSRAAYWDGEYARHLNPEKRYTIDAKGNTKYSTGFNETRIGLYMAWSGNRLWVFDGTKGYASDQNDPLHFTEELALTNVPYFLFPEPVTGCIDRGTSGIQNNVLFVFTANQTYTLWSGILNRPAWATTGDFQRKVFSGVGCVSHKSICTHMGLLYWYSSAGIVAFDSLGTVTSTQALPPIDSEMAYSKHRMATDRSRICAGFYNSYVFWSVPVGPSADNNVFYNGHTQVMDRVTAPVNIGVGTVIPYGISSWQGIWTGIRPVEWKTVFIDGKEHTYCLSMDYDGYIRIWKGFQGNRADNGKQIEWAIETKLHPVSDTPFSKSVFRHFRLLLEQVKGNLSISGSWKGMRGQYHELLNTEITATPGPIFLNDAEIVNNTESESYSKQSRELISQDQRKTIVGSANVESRDGDAIDRAFSLSLRLKGVGALFAYRLAVDNNPDNTEGRVETPETGLHILPESGDPEFKLEALPLYEIPDALDQDAITPFIPRYVETGYQAPGNPCSVGSGPKVKWLSGGYEYGNGDTVNIQILQQPSLTIIGDIGSESVDGVTKITSITCPDPQIEIGSDAGMTPLNFPIKISKSMTSNPGLCFRINDITTPEGDKTFPVYIKNTSSEEECVILIHLVWFTIRGTYDTSENTSALLSSVYYPVVIVEQENEDIPTTSSLLSSSYFPVVVLKQADELSKSISALESASYFQAVVLKTITPEDSKLESGLVSLTYFNAVVARTVSPEVESSTSALVSAAYAHI